MTAAGSTVQRAELSLKVDGVRLALVEFPVGTDRPVGAVLLVHGSGCGFECWDVPFAGYSVAAALASAGLAVFALQCRGYAGSDAVPGRQVDTAGLVADMGAAMAWIATERNHRTISLVGHSSSGAAVLLVAAAGAARLGRIAVIGTPYARMHEAFAPYIGQIMEQYDRSNDGYIENSHHQTIEERLDAPETRVVDWYRKLITERYRRIPGAILADHLRMPAEGCAGAVRAPTMVINGAREYVVDRLDASRLFAEIAAQDKTYVQLPGSYHLPFLEPKGARGLGSALSYWLSRP